VENQKKGLLSRVFGAKRPCCCNVQIEEVKEEQEAGKSGDIQSGSGCCDQRPSGKS